MNVHALGGDEDDHSGPDTQSSCRRMYPSGSTSLDLEGHSSEAEVEDLLSPSWLHRGEYQEQSHRRRHSRSGHQRSRRFVYPEGSSDSETHSEFDDCPPLSTTQPNRRRNVMFSLSQSRAGASGSSSGHTISGGTLSSVGGSQKIIRDHSNSNHTAVANYGFINITLHIHGVGDSNSKTFFNSVGLFGRGDCMTMRCT